MCRQRESEGALDNRGVLMADEVILMKSGMQLVRNESKTQGMVEVWWNA